MKAKIIRYCILFGIGSGTIFLFFSGCTNPDKNIVYSADNPDPYPPNWDVAIIDSLRPVKAYPTDRITIIGTGFNTTNPDYNYVWFEMARANVLEVWPESLHVKVPPPNPLNPNYFFADSVDVKIALQNSYSWSNKITFIFKPMAHAYVASSYPANHPEDKFTKPRGLEFDRSGNMYLANNRLRSIYKDTPEGSGRTVFAFSSNLRVDGGMRMGPDGFLYAAGNADNIIYRIPPGGGSVENWVSVPSPWGMDFDDAGNLFVVDNKKGHLYKVSPDRSLKKVIELPGTEEKAYCRVFNGFVYINRKGTGELFRISATADQPDSAEIIIASPGKLINDVTFGIDGSMYITASESGSYSLIKVSPSGKEQTVVALAGDLGFLTWYGKFLYISSLTGPVYKVLIHDNNSAPYYGR